MTDMLTKRIRRAKRLLIELLFELGSDSDIPFSAEQCDLLEKRFYEIRCALDGE
jgi:hypothetical protein